MSQIDPQQVELLRLYLSGRDVGCPGCGYNLRDQEGVFCPECGRPCVLSLADARTSQQGLTWPFAIGLAAAFAGTVTGLVNLIYWVLNVLVYDIPLDEFLVYIVRESVVTVLLFAVALGWLLLGGVMKRLPPMGQWALAAIPVVLSFLTIVGTIVWDFAMDA